MVRSAGGTSMSRTELERVVASVSIDDVLAIARDASTLIMEGFRRAPATRAKQKSDLVTEFDERSERLLRDRLLARFPEHAFLGEEGSGHASMLDGTTPTWVVDPIDGTSNFAHGHPYFCIAIGLVVRGEPILGVVSAPAMGLTFHGALGRGAFRNGTAMRVSETDALETSLLATGFPADRHANPDNNYRAFIELDRATHGVRRCAAAALEIAMVADGAYDGFWDLGLKPWDIAASTLLVREAGGVVTNLDRSELSLTRGRFLATNGRIHGALGAALESEVARYPGADLVLRGSDRVG